MRLFLQIFALTAVLAFPIRDARAGDLTPEEIRAARKLHNTKCVRCHKAYDPAAYNETAWREWMDKMSRKAKLKSDQKELLARYLDDVRKQKQNAQHDSTAEQPSH